MLKIKTVLIYHEGSVMRGVKIINYVLGLLLFLGTCFGVSAKAGGSSYFSARYRGADSAFLTMKDAGVPFVGLGWLVWSEIDPSSDYDPGLEDFLYQMIQKYY